jgi:hypothetical protein
MALMIAGVTGAVATPPKKDASLIKDNGADISIGSRIKDNFGLIRHNLLIIIKAAFISEFFLVKFL